MDAPADSFDSLAQVLAALHERFGTALFSDRRRLIGLLSDHVPDAKREIRAMATALDEGVADTLQHIERHLAGVESDRLANRLENATGLRPDLARQAVRSYVHALGLGPLPSVYAGAPPPPPAPDSWAGVSEGVPAISPKPPPRSGYVQIPSIGVELPAKALYGGVAALGLALVAAFVVLPDAGPGADISVAAEDGYAGELTDFGIASKSVLESDVGSPTPLAIPAGKRITTADLTALLKAQPATILVDVLANPHPETIRGSVWAPAGGAGGSFSDDNQRQFVQQMQKLVRQHPGQPLVFFCAGARCWESYNAVLRANSAGLRGLYWYRGGLAAWSSAGLPMGPLPQE